MGFVHLHVHSQFSILNGTATVDALARQASELGMSALALTDSANMFGAVSFYKACVAQGIKPILGAELYLAPEGLDGSGDKGEAEGQPFIALVENAEGYRSLCELITAGIFDGMHYKPRVDFALLERWHQGLIFLTGGRKGLIGRPVLQGEEGKARALVARLAALVGEEQLFLELSDQGLPDQDRVNAHVRELSRALDLKTVVTNAVHYLRPDDAPVLEVLNAISLGCSLTEAGRVQSPTDQAWLKSEEEIRAVFPDDADAIERTVQIAERCNYAFDFDTYHFPATTPPDITSEGPQPDTDANWAYFYQAFPPPVDFNLPDPEVEIPERPEGAGNLSGYFSWYSHEGLRLRLRHVDAELHPVYHERLEYELKVIADMGFPAYLLIVAEFINWSKDNGIPVGPGRGSAAGSLVAYALRITDIDPIRYGLLFERFLNPERVSMPDIDVDFCQDRREEAIEHVREKYGSALVSQIITYGTLKAKAAVRDASRVLDFSFMEADRIAKLVPDVLGIKLVDALEQEPRLARLREGDPKIRRLLDVAMAIEGAVRQTGVHAAGVVIADRPLVEYAPLYRDEPGGGPVVQYDMKSAEGIGLIKFDFLGLKTLDQIRDAVIAIEENHGIKVDIGHVDEEDEQTYALLQDGDALGVFQLESSGMRELLARLRPSSMDDMVALVALYRPGPLQSGMVDDFVERKHGRVPVEYPHPLLETLLKPTYGTIIYQEQVMQIAQQMAGYSLGEADLLRRAMGKKKAEEMAKQEARFVEGSVRQGIDEDKAREIFNLLAKFAAYGFNKSHSAAYGYISYQTAWLKAHYRSEYMAALMTIESANTDKVLQYILDCRRDGIRVEPVCVNASEQQFSVPKVENRPKDEEGAPIGVIRFGLGAVKGIGASAVEAILEAREEAGGTFRTASEFFERLDYRRVNRRVLEHLIKAGALDVFEVPRSALVEGLEAAMAMGHRHQQDQAAGQIGLFGAGPERAKRSLRWPDIPEYPFSERLAFEREVLGLYLSGHPMQAHERDVERYAKGRSIGRAADYGDLEEVQLLGLVIDVRVIKTRRGDKMAFVKLEDTESAIDCVFFSDAWARSYKAVNAGEPLLVTGRVEPGEEPKLRASTAEVLSDIRARSTREVKFSLRMEELAGDRLSRFVAILRGQRGGCKARLILECSGGIEAELKLPSCPVEPSASLEESVHALFGRDDVVVLL